MNPNAHAGEIITVILRSGARLAGPYEPVNYGYGDPTFLVDGWAVDPAHVQAWKRGVWPTSKSTPK